MAVRKKTTLRLGGRRTNTPLYRAIRNATTRVVRPRVPPTWPFSLRHPCRSCERVWHPHHAVIFSRFFFKLKEPATSRSLHWHGAHHTYHALSSGKPLQTRDAAFRPSSRKRSLRGLALMGRLQIYRHGRCRRVPFYCSFCFAGSLAPRVSPSRSRRFLCR